MPGVAFRMLALVAALAALSAGCQREGLLLALRHAEAGLGPDEPGRDVYRTLWVVRKGDVVRLADERPDVLVPLPGGRLHRLRVARRNVYEHYEDAVKLTHRDDGLDGEEILTSAVRSTGRTDEWPDCVVYQHATLIFVGPDSASVDWRIGLCNAGTPPGQPAPEYGYYARALLGRPGPLEPRPPLDIAAVAGREGLDALHAGAAAFVDRAAAAPPPGLECVERRPNILNWAVRRHQARWILRGRLSRPLHVGCVAGVHDFDIPLDAPAAIVGHDALPVPWAAVVEAAPDAVDAFGSPDGGTLLVQTPDALVAFFPRNGVVGRPAARIPLAQAEEVAVMTRWVSGRRAVRDVGRQLARFVDP